MNLENCSPHRPDFNLYARDNGPTREQMEAHILHAALNRITNAGCDNWGQTCELDSEPKFDGDGASYALLFNTVSVLGLKKQLRRCSQHLKGFEMVHWTTIPLAMCVWLGLSTAIFVLLARNSSVDE